MRSYRKYLNKVFLMISVVLTSCYLSVGQDMLVEAEHFENKGGWFVDQQFEEQMGSSYLLAHGLGEPVENANTTIEFSKSGEYHLWVRTKNWAQGNWEAPGRFKLNVNGKLLPMIFGTESGWDWQYGGQVYVESGLVTLELQDLTGFDGRCDAIYFSKSNEKPPKDLESLKGWRKKKQMKLQKKFEHQSFDIVVIGGGLAGCGAAIAAAEKGMNVALVNDRPVFGGNASSEIRVSVNGIQGNAAHILNKIDRTPCAKPNGSAQAIEDQQRREKVLREYPNISLFPFCRAFGVEMKQTNISSIKIKEIPTGKLMKLFAPVFIDCTGDGWIGYWAGADYSYGREPVSKYGEEWDKYKDLWSPICADNKVMGSSLLWNSQKMDNAVIFPEVPWALNVAKGHAAINGEWYWEYSSDHKHQIADAETIRDHLLKAIFGSFYNAKKQKGNEYYKLKWVSYILGKRESRRLIGDYVFTLNDAVTGLRHEDDIAEEIREVDVHYQQIETDSLKPDFLSRAMFKKTPRYYIPYRCLYSRNIDNLLMAGRCFSCSHVGLGGPRVMNTTGQMGVAAGYAAYLCVKNKTTPRGIYNDYLSDLKELTGY